MGAAPSTGVDPPAAQYHLNIESFNGGLYGLSGRNQANNGPCLPAIGALATIPRPRPGLRIPAQPGPAELSASIARLAGLHPRHSGYTVRTAPAPAPGGTDAYQ